MFAALDPVVHEFAVEVFGFAVFCSLVVSGASSVVIFGDSLSAPVISVSVSAPSVIEIPGALSEGSLIPGAFSPSITKSTSSSVASCVLFAFVISHDCGVGLK